MRCLAKAPAERPSAAEVACKLGSLADGAPSPLEDLGLCAAPFESGHALAGPIVEPSNTGVRASTQPWRRTLKANR